MARREIGEGMKRGLQLLTTIPELAAVADPAATAAPSVLVNVGVT